MSKILLSINPEHVENILKGNKTYEYRKVRCRENIDTIIIYSTSPVMRVIGEAKILEVIDDTPDRVWEETSSQSGISKEFFCSYFKNKKRAIAYKLGTVIKYKNMQSLTEYGINSAPQSFVYIT